MYGLINQGLHDLAVQAGGEELWREIKSTAGVGLEAFVGMDTYPDDITYRLVEAASAAMGISLGGGPARLRQALDPVHRTSRVRCDLRHDGTHPARISRQPRHDARQAEPEHARDEATVVRVRAARAMIRSASSTGRSAPGLRQWWSVSCEGLGEMYGVTVSVDQSIDRAHGADHDEFVIDCRRNHADDPRHR